jgi:predicted  nucleic acid-binding Zn-ribbon protein
MTLGLIEDPEGGYVDFDDYQALESENTILKRRDSNMVKELKKLEEENATLKQSWHEGREQGIWEAVAKLARENKDLAISVANEMEIGTKNIHEFDWENFTEIFGSKEAFLTAFKGE